MIGAELLPITHHFIYLVVELKIVFNLAVKSLAA